MILADPPWLFTTRSPKGKGRSAEQHYGCMSLDEIKALPVASLAAPDCALFMWVTDPCLRQGLDVMDSWGFCVGTGTRVLTDDLRWVPAEELEVGDGLLAFDERAVGGRRYYRKGRVLSTGVEPLPSYRITLDTGEKIIASSEHAWLATVLSKNGDPRTHRWIKTRELKFKAERYGVDIAFPRLAPVCTPDRSYESGFLSGAFDSEGSLSMGKGGIRFSQNDNPLMAEVKAALKQRGYNYSHYDRSAVDACDQIYITGGLRTVMRFMMECRPPRLLRKWQDQNLTASLYNLGKVKVVAVEDIGLRECVTLTTSTGTYIAEGYGAHNTYKTVGFTWAKTNAKSEGWFTGMGYYTRSNPEMCLIGTRGAPKRLSKAVRQLVVAPRREHSRKPDEVHERIMSLFPGPYMELFARSERSGWVTWGNETGKFRSEKLTRPGHGDTVCAYTLPT